MLKGLYEGILYNVEKIPLWMEKEKTTIAEDLSIRKKRKLIDSVVWTDEQQQEFDAFWINNYGKKIPNKWHRLYQAVSGKFAVDYVPEKLYTTVIEPFFNDRKYGTVLQDKSFVETLANGCGSVVPETIVVCSANHLFDGDRHPISLGQAIALLKDAGSVVFKPTVGSSSGRGISFFETLEDRQEDEIAQIIERYGKDFIVQKKIKQHPAFAAFNPSSINTIRITTFLIDGEIHHVPLAFRIGRKDKNVDNIHAGGIGVGVEDDGTLLPVGFELGYGNKVIKYAEHPDSKVLFAGYLLPIIPEIIQSAYSVHSKMPHTGIISWDFTVDSLSHPVLIEANILGQGIWFPQMIHGKGAFGPWTKKILEIIR